MVFGVLLNLLSVLIGFWMGKKTVRPEERVFTSEKVSNDDSDIINTPDLFHELAQEEEKDERIKTA